MLPTQTISIELNTGIITDYFRAISHDRKPLKGFFTFAYISISPWRFGPKQPRAGIAHLGNALHLALPWHPTPPT